VKLSGSASISTFIYLVFLFGREQADEGARNLENNTKDPKVLNGIVHSDSLKIPTTINVWCMTSTIKRHDNFVYAGLH
jgi:hypothetical protein